jgi:hypothetical protein
MTYETSEKSIQSGTPLELYTFELSGGTYRHTTAIESVTIGGNLYTPAPGLSRANVGEVPLGENHEVIVTMKVTHAIAADLIKNGIPPRKALLTIERIHDPTDTPYRVFRGGIAEIETDAQFAQLRVRSSLAIAFDVKLPLFKASRICQHALYGPGCQVVRGGGVTNVIAVNGTSITVNIADPDGTANGGEIVRLADDEKRTILTQVGQVVVVDVPFRTLAANDSVALARGCDGQIKTCRDVFNNVANFGGHPDLPEVNPSAPPVKKPPKIWDQLR